MPSRLELAFALARLAEARWPLDGASDHLVSEALYLSDPDGNGIEIYRDRPRDQWQLRDGQLQMATLPLDLRDLLGELSGHNAHSPYAPAGTRMGHVHLQVSELEQTEASTTACSASTRWSAPTRGTVRVGRRLSPPHRAEHMEQRGLRATGARRRGPPRLRGGTPGRAAFDAVLARIDAAGLKSSRQPGRRPDRPRPVRIAILSRLPA